MKNFANAIQFTPYFDGQSIIEQTQSIYGAFSSVIPYNSVLDPVLKVFKIDSKIIEPNNVANNPTRKAHSIYIEATIIPREGITPVFTSEYSVQTGVQKVIAMGVAEDPVIANGGIISDITFITPTSENGFNFSISSYMVDEAGVNNRIFLNSDVEFELTLHMSSFFQTNELTALVKGTYLLL